MHPSSTTHSTSDAEGHDVEAALLERIAAGDTEALGALYDRFSRPLYALARQILNDATEAEDIVHEVFVMLAEKAGGYDVSRGSAFTWAATLTRHRAIDRLRKRRRRGELLAEAALSDLGYHERSAASSDPFRTKEISASVRRAFAQLPADQRSAIELAYFGGLTQQEIAARLSAPLGTVKARIRRGLLSLRSLIDVRP